MNSHLRGNKTSFLELKTWKEAIHSGDGTLYKISLDAIFGMISFWHWLVTWGSVTALCKAGSGVRNNWDGGSFSPKNSTPLSHFPHLQRWIMHKSSDSMFKHKHKSKNGDDGDLVTRMVVQRVKLLFTMQASSMSSCCSSFHPVPCWCTCEKSKTWPGPTASVFATYVGEGDKVSNSWVWSGPAHCKCHPGSGPADRSLVSPSFCHSYLSNKIQTKLSNPLSSVYILQYWFTDPSTLSS